MTNTNNTNKMRTTRTLLIIGSAFPLLANAQIETRVETLTDVRGILQNIVGWAQVFFYVVAAFFIILGAWDYLNSGGEAEKTKKAKERILYSLVAIAIAVIAGGVVKMVESFINTTP